MSKELTPDPGFAEGNIVTFSLDGSETLYKGVIRGISTKHVLTFYIIEILPQCLIWFPDTFRFGLSREYPFTCVNIQHTFINTVWPSKKEATNE